MCDVISANPAPHILIVYDTYEIHHRKYKKVQAEAVAARLREKGIKVTIADIDAVKIENDALFVNGQRLDPNTVNGVWWRASVRQPKKIQENLKKFAFIEGRIPPFGSYQSVIDADSKVATHQRLSEAQVSVPKTFIVPVDTEKDAINKIVEDHCTALGKPPYIVKKDRGQGGLGVCVAYDVGTVKARVKEWLKEAQERHRAGVLIQQAIPINSERRIELIVDHELKPHFLFALDYKKKNILALTVEDEERLRPYCGKDKLPQNLVRLNEEDWQLAVRATKVFGPGVYGVEVVGDDPCCILEVNPFSAQEFDKISQNKTFLGIDIHGKIADTLIEFLNRNIAKTSVDSSLVHQCSHKGLLFSNFTPPIHRNG